VALEKYRASSVRRDAVGPRSRAGRPRPRAGSGARAAAPAPAAAPRSRDRRAHAACRRPQEAAAALLLALAAAAALALLAARLWARRAFGAPRPGVVAFFHPFADGGGGGERVLWCAVQALQAARPDLRLAIYCRPGPTAAALAAGAAARFGLAVAPTFDVVPLPAAARLAPELYPRFTVARQAAASVAAAAAALRALPPALWVDTTGWAFPYPLVRAAGARVAAYTHYPTVSRDMIGGASAGSRRPPPRSAAGRAARRLYFHARAAAYGAAGGAADVAMANSKWTAARVGALWWRRAPPALVYPPVDTADLAALPLDRRLKRLYVLCVAQFRPEKDHETALRAFAAARAAAPRLPDARAAAAVAGARLQLVGGVRGPADAARLAALRGLAARLGLAEPGAVEFLPDAPHTALRALLADAAVGLHCMRDEHFGISVVEYMAAGLVPVAHDSGGPREDIVVPVAALGGGGGTERTGLRAEGVDGFRDALLEALAMPQGERLRVAAAARRRAADFSDARFKAEFLEQLAPVLPPRQPHRD
jgi:alpha-1,2-mannosyltransferase